MSERLRILHVITGLNLGGAESWLVRLVAGLDRSRFDCRVVSLIPEGVLAAPLRKLGVPVESLGMSRGVPSLAALRKLSGLLRQWRPHVLQSWLYHADLLSFGAAWLARRGPHGMADGSGASGPWTGSLSWGIRCAEMDLARYGLSTRLAIRACAALSGRVEAVVANSQAGAAHHIQKLGYSPRTMRVLPNGVDTERFQPDPDSRRALRAEWGVEPGEVLVGLVARVDPMKGHELFCQAAALARSTHPELRFVLCGEGTQPGEPGSEVLESLLAQNDLGVGLLRLGRRSDVRRVFAALDIIALPSLAEGFPNALAEGLACGVPAVAFAVGDAAAIMTSGEDDLNTEVGAGTEVEANTEDTGGLLVPVAPGLARDEADAERFAQALRDMAEAGPDVRAELGRLGRELVLRKYSLRTALERWTAHFEALAEPKI